MSIKASGCCPTTSLKLDTAMDIFSLNFSLKPCKNSYFSEYIRTGSSLLKRSSETLPFMHLSNRVLQSQ